MPEVSHRQLSDAHPLKPTALIRKLEIRDLHERCGIYTKPDVVGSILDQTGWVPSAKLFQNRLLEPAAGDGAFVVEAARRLIFSCRKFNVDPKVNTIGDCIRSFELHPGEAKSARRRLSQTLRQLKVHCATAEALALRWVTCGDFLLTPISSRTFTHAVGNPPYVRWSKIPTHLKDAYKQSIPREFTGGDLFLPFLDRALEQLKSDGICGFICSDRWRFMAFAEAFRQKWLPRLRIISELQLLSADAFLKDVDAYPTVLIAARCQHRKRPPKPSNVKTIRELGFAVKVGPALGHTAAFVLRPEENDVEPELLRPWIDASEIHDGRIDWGGKRVVVMHDTNGLIDIKKYPMLSARLDRFRKQLSKRAIVENGAPWYRPIDRVIASNWSRPKLLLPELAKIPRIAVDRSGAIPSHGVYAIFADEEQIDTLFEKLGNGRLASALEDIAPRVKGGFVRCYKRFLDEIRLT
jgi:adenine-specific DNA-methyltransferase